MTLRFPFLSAVLLAVALPLQAQDAAALRAQANAEPNQEKQVLLLCRAADLQPKNKDFRKDCDVSKAALISSDRQALKTAQDASDAGQLAKAQRYAKYVSSLDPDLHHEAVELLARLSKPETPSTPAAAPAVAANAPAGNAAPSSSTTQSTASLSAATAAYEAGNFAAARASAQAVTDPNLKPAANRLLADMERYASLLASGQRQEQAREYAQAERSYGSALELNSHVGSDDLNGRIQRLHALASGGPANATPPPAVASTAPSKTPLPKPAATDTRNAKLQLPEIPPEEKKRQLLLASTQAMSRNDLDTAGRGFKQVLDLDPSNAEAKRGIATINATLSRDPVRLENTLRAAIAAFYASRFEDAESGLNRYLGAEGGKRKGAAYFYLGATETTLALLDQRSKRKTRQTEAGEDFKLARQAGYQPLPQYVSDRILAEWKSSAS